MDTSPARNVAEMGISHVLNVMEMDMRFVRIAMVKEEHCALHVAAQGV